MKISQPFRKQFPKPVRKSRLFCYNYLVSKTSTARTSIFPSISPFGIPQTSTKFHSFREKAPQRAKNNRPFVCKRRLLCLVCLYHFSKTYASSKASLPSPQMGHSKLSATSSQGVPGAIPWLGSPTLGSYSYPQGKHIFSYQ